MVIISEDNGESWSLFDPASTVSLERNSIQESNLAAVVSSEEETIFQKFFNFLKSFFGAVVDFFVSLF